MKQRIINIYETIRSKYIHKLHRLFQEAYSYKISYKKKEISYKKMNCAQFTHFKNIFIKL
jgi:hypothetical protein